MASKITLFDPANPMARGTSILTDVLAGRDVVAARDALAHALYSAAQLVSEKWDALAEETSGWLRSGGDIVVTFDLEKARSELRRATEAAEAIFAAVLSAETQADPQDIAAMLRNERAEVAS